MTTHVKANVKLPRQNVAISSFLDGTPRYSIHKFTYNNKVFYRSANLHRANAWLPFRLRRTDDDVVVGCLRRKVDWRSSRSR